MNKSMSKSTFVICTVTLFLVLVNLATSKSTDADTKVLVKADGVDYSIDNINEKSSYLKFYSSNSDMNHDADFELVSDDKNERLTVIIDGLDGKGKDILKGNVQLGSNSTLITYKKGDLSISFSEGELNIEEISKTSGVVRLKAKGLCTIKKGKSYANMKLDIPVELEVNAIIMDVKTLDYKKN